MSLSSLFLGSFHIFLSVLDIVPPEQVIDIGREARLECLTEERDRASILWRKDGEVISPSSNIVQASKMSEFIRFFIVRSMNVIWIKICFNILL